MVHFLDLEIEEAILDQVLLVVEVGPELRLLPAVGVHHGQEGAEGVEDIVTPLDVLLLGRLPHVGGWLCLEVLAPIHICPLEILEECHVHVLVVRQRLGDIVAPSQDPLHGVVAGWCWSYSHWRICLRSVVVLVVGGVGSWKNTW